MSTNRACLEFDRFPPSRARLRLSCHSSPCDRRFVVALLAWQLRGRIFSDSSRDRTFAIRGIETIWPRPQNPGNVQAPPPLRVCWLFVFLVSQQPPVWHVGTLAKTKGWPRRLAAGHLTSPYPSNRSTCLLCQVASNETMTDHLSLAMATPTAAASGVSLPPTSNALTAPASITSATSGATPAIPPRPDSLAASVNQNASAYSRMNQPYNSAYSSPYSNIGGYGSRMYGGMGGMGGMGSMYGGMGSMYGGMGSMYGGGMYGGMPGMNPNDPNGQNSLTNSFNNSTQATFQMLEGIVGAFGGFAQMLESTYMATHSSFFGE